MGDPAGISPELAAKLLAVDEMGEAAQLVIFGDRRILEMGAKVAGVPLDLEIVESVEASRTSLVGRSWSISATSSPMR